MRGVGWGLVAGFEAVDFGDEGLDVRWGRAFGGIVGGAFGGGVTLGVEDAVDPGHGLDAVLAELGEDFEGFAGEGAVVDRLGGLFVEFAGDDFGVGVA